MSDRSIEVHCDKHGPSFAAFVCRHLASGIGRGFFSSDDGTGRDPCPDAWCAECDALMMQTGEWTEEAERYAGITVVCANCYGDIKKRALRRRRRRDG